MWVICVWPFDLFRFCWYYGVHTWVGEPTWGSDSMWEVTFSYDERSSIKWNWFDYILLNTFNYMRVVLIVLRRSCFGTVNYRDRELIVRREIGIRISTTRRDGRVFAKLRNFPHKSTRSEGARLLCRALHAERKALIGWHTRAPSLWLVESRAPCTRYPQTDALDWIRSYYSAVRVAILLSGPCRTVMSRLL